jgi:hypothetical protein
MGISGQLVKRKDLSCKVKGKGKGKIKFVPMLLTEHYSMKKYWGVEL